jgi:copper chaperone CopZ
MIFLDKHTQNKCYFYFISDNIIFTYKIYEMKALRTLFTLILIVVSTSMFAQDKTTTSTFKVQGNCGSCKKHIETAVTVDGVVKADWDKTTKLMTVTYNASKISLDDIEKKIAAVGYDTEKFKGDDKAYNNLDDCCKYERKKQ